MAQQENKVMTANEAIRRFVHDGDHLVIGNYTVGTCAELEFEVIRQRKKQRDGWRSCVRGLQTTRGCHWFHDAVDTTPSGCACEEGRTR
ncbi:MAG: hypothetical protein RRA35_11650 [Desulfomonilia bacterium]|nr:hypothetical protein [Desulfomonilia bacterium]